MPVSESDLLRYFAARDEQRQHDISEALPQLDERMRHFVDEHAADPNLPAFVARLIREAIVAAHVRGVMRGRAGGEPPKDSVAFYEALETLRGHDDLYPAWRAFDRRGQDDESEG